jgi:tripartite-type tricarboxylate transporter receptor subunit TctC
MKRRDLMVSAIVRPLVDTLTADLERPVTIEYKPGAAGAIAAAAFEGSAPDGGALINQRGPSGPDG